MQSKGFTLIELTIVIVIIAVLAITATNKFLAINEDAEAAKAQGYASAFKQAVDFAKAKWAILGNRSYVVNLPDYLDGNLDVNNYGYPVGINKGNNAGNMRNPFQIGRNGVRGCIDLWNTLLEDAPSIARNNNNQDYRAYTFSSGENLEAPTARDSCVYVLRKLGDNENYQNAKIKFTYNASTGQVLFEDNR